MDSKEINDRFITGLLKFVKEELEYQRYDPKTIDEILEEWKKSQDYEDLKKKTLAILSQAKRLK
jgi:hypothetical protein